MGGNLTKIDGQYVESLILNGALEGNILPLTSSCNVHCIFCSHRQNPAGVQVYHIAPRSMAEVKRTLSYMDSSRPVIIGESVTRIIEGEPFTHPLIKEILQLIRITFPFTTIQLTTNGCLIDGDMADFLRKLGGVVVNLSINSATELGRAMLMGDTAPHRSLKSAALLQGHGITYHGSIVAMPHLVGWQDLEQTINWLALYDAETIRVFLPGFSKLASPALRFEPHLWEELVSFVDGLKDKLLTPLSCEPPFIHDLQPQVAGVIAGSPAARAGVRSGDIIKEINNTAALSRVHAFKQVLASPHPAVTLHRGGRIIKLKISKAQGERSGLVMDYDIDPSVIINIARVIRQQRAAEVLVLTSELAGRLMKMALASFIEDIAQIKLLVVHNRFFGGSIKAAGLLTVADCLSALEEYFQKPWRPQLILLPGLAFDRSGRDITGRSYFDIEEKYRIAVKVL
ncbi:MAG: molybdenum cofactor biosynthesis protein A [Pelotomaculum sp. PtaB.Bin104]|nr:MAG: molybdenum cofactor biosynthesis protein A [Pelotomaculum sp. PtaB.Bin104]